jgi:hypothetical protein
MRFAEKHYDNCRLNAGFRLPPVQQAGNGRLNRQTASPVMPTFGLIGERMRLPHGRLLAGDFLPPPGSLGS